MANDKAREITSLISKIPYRMAFAGGWIDQPFLSKLVPTPPGSMVVVALEPTFRFMDRCGMATSTRQVAKRLWGGEIPHHDPEEMTRELYAEENKGLPEPSGSQDMAGLLYPGINRLDFDYSYEDGYFPVHVESNTDPKNAQWLEKVIHMVPINQRPANYNPLGIKNLDPEWVRRLSQSGKDCYSSIVARDIHGLAASMNDCMVSWEKLLPHVVAHPTITIDLKAILAYYQDRYEGAMYSGCGGGYLYVVSEEMVPGSLQIKVRIG